MTSDVDDRRKYDDDVAGLAEGLFGLLAPDGWTITSGRMGGDSGPTGITFEHPVSGEFQFSVGRRPRDIAGLERELREFVHEEREFELVRRLPKPVTHPQLLLVLRSEAFGYQWSAATVAQVAEAMLRGRTLDADEAAWFALAGPVIWGPIPTWAVDLRT
jgi:hypothetical protein